VPESTVTVDVKTVRARSSAEFVLDGAVDVVEQRLADVIERTARFRLRERRADRIEATARANWATWGARITLVLWPEAAARTRVRVHVDPLVQTTLFDYGQGRRDIQTLYEASR
jgi:hypothetical protein